MRKPCPTPPGPGSVAASPPVMFVQNRCSVSQDIPSLNIGKLNGRAGSSTAIRDSAGRRRVVRQLGAARRRRPQSPGGEGLEDGCQSERRYAQAEVMAKSAGPRQQSAVRDDRRISRSRQQGPAGRAGAQRPAGGQSEHADRPAIDQVQPAGARPGKRSRKRSGEHAGAVKDAGGDRRHHGG
jgi:hypothetical protein